MHRMNCGSVRCRTVISVSSWSLNWLASVAEAALLLTAVEFERPRVRGGGAFFANSESNPSKDDVRSTYRKGPTTTTTTTSSSSSRDTHTQNKDKTNNQNGVNPCTEHTESNGSGFE
jgi:hypothetical protein